MIKERLERAYKELKIIFVRLPSFQKVDFAARSYRAATNLNCNCHFSLHEIWGALFLQPVLLYNISLADSI